MTIDELIRVAIKKLKNSTSPALDGEVLLSFVLKKPKKYLLANPKRIIIDKLKREYLKLINKRLLGWPVAYLTHEKEFFGLKFYVDKNVLIPRPETEGLVELVLSKIKMQKAKVKILDIGTGSGNIIISLAKNLPGKFFASDVSSAALKIAKQNAKYHKTKITFKQGSLLNPWTKQHFDIIIANLPYLHRETDTSTKFEPKTALIASKKGLALYEKLFQKVSTLTPHPSTLLLEIGHDQTGSIKKLAVKLLPAFEIKIFKDLSGHSRYALLQLVQKLS